MMAAMCLVTVAAQAKVELPSFYTDNMVVQRESVLTVRGTARPQSQVTFRADWKNGKVTGRADGDGRFTLRVPTPEAGGPYTLIVDDGTEEGRKVLQNVLVGEVWLCSGQSNMEFPLRGDWARVMDDDRVVATMQCPTLRLLQIRNTTSVKALEDASVEMGWVESSPAAANFSAIGYLCGRMLQDSLKVPVGVIDASWGGTPVEAWTPREYLKDVPGWEFCHEMLASGRTEREIVDATLQRLYQDDRRQMSYPFDRGVMQRGTAWGRMPVPSLWEANELPGFDGIVVMQYELELPAEAAGKPLQLHLGAVDDADMTYFNGAFVGSVAHYEHARDYNVDGSLVKGGRNVITVEVIDNAGGGGIWKPCHATVDGKEYSLDGIWNYAVLADLAGKGGDLRLPGTPYYPSVLYNAMINPLTVMPVAGVFWYQGCANVGNAEQYEKCFKNMICGWRESFGNPELPFYFVQLAGFQQPVLVQPESEWALLRQAQANVSELPHTGMAVAVDLGNPVDIHPVNKQEVARRLGLLALDKTYGRPQACSAPECVDVKIDKDAVVLTFDGAVRAEGGAVTGFIIKDAEGNWAYADARLTDGGKVRLSSPLIRKPVAARYNWADYPGGNLTGVVSGLPVAPFATDK